MKKSFLAILAVPLLLVGCKTNNSGGNGNGGGGNITPPGGDSIQPTDKAEAFKDACADQELGFEISVEDVESEGTKPYITYGFVHLDSNHYGYYFIYSERVGTGWDSGAFDIYMDQYNNGQLEESTHFDGATSTSLGRSGAAMDLIAMMAYVGQEAVSATATKTDHTLLSHACDKYTITTYGDTVNYYISKSLGFTLQCDYDIQGEGTGYVYKLEGITTLGNPMFMALA